MIKLMRKVLPEMLRYTTEKDKPDNLDIRLLKGFYVTNQCELMDEKDKCELEEDELRKWTKEEVRELLKSRMKEKFSKKTPTISDESKIEIHPIKTSHSSSVKCSEHSGEMSERADIEPPREMSQIETIIDDR